MTWFQVLTGFHETSPSQVRENITVAGDKLTSVCEREGIHFWQIGNSVFGGTARPCSFLCTRSWKDISP